MKKINSLPLFIFFILILVGCKDESLLINSHNKFESSDLNGATSNEDAVNLMTEFNKQYDSSLKGDMTEGVMATSIAKSNAAFALKIAKKPDITLEGLIIKDTVNLAIDGLYPISNDSFKNSLKNLYHFYYNQYNQFIVDFQNPSKLDTALYLRKSRNYYINQIDSFKLGYLSVMNPSIRIGYQEYSTLVGTAQSLSLGFDSLVIKTLKAYKSKPLTTINKVRYNSIFDWFVDACEVVFNPMTYVNALIDVVMNVGKGDPLSIGLKVITFSRNTVKFGMAIIVSDKVFGSDNKLYNSTTSLILSKSWVGSTIKSFYFSRKVASGDGLSVFSSVYSNSIGPKVFPLFWKKNETITNYVAVHSQSDNIKYARLNADAAIAENIHNGLKMDNTLNESFGIVSVNQRYAFGVYQGVCGIYNLFTNQWATIYARGINSVSLNHGGYKQYLYLKAIKGLSTQIMLTETLSEVINNKPGLVDYLIIGDDGLLHVYSYSRDAVSVKVRGDRPIQYKNSAGIWTDIYRPEGTQFEVIPGSGIDNLGCYGYYRTKVIKKTFGGYFYNGSLRIPFESIASSSSK